MIAHLRGTLLAKRPNQAIVETHGVGYDVSISVPTFTEMPAAGADVALHIHTHVREDALSLYGFLRLAEKQLFEKLLTVRPSMRSFAMPERSTSASIAWPMNQCAPCVE